MLSWVTVSAEVLRYFTEVNYCKQVDGHIQTAE